MRDGAGEPVEPPDRTHVEAAFVRVGHATGLILAGSLSCRSPRVDVLPGDRPAACLRELRSSRVCMDTSWPWLIVDTRA